jgi:hypothetical protein
VNLKRKNFALLYESMKRLDLSKSLKFQKYYAEKITPKTTYSLKSHHIRAIEKRSEIHKGNNERNYMLHAMLSKNI